MAPPLGFKHSPETRAKMLVSHKRLSGSNHPRFGKKHSPSSLQKMRDVKLGKPGCRKGAKHTKESLEKMRKSHGTGALNPLFGKTRSEETKNKIRVALLGHTVSDDTKKKISKTVHEKLPEYIQKLVAAWANPERREKQLAFMHSAEYIQSRRDQMVGEKHHAWKGGISFEPYCPKFNDEFKERVRTYFGNFCIECGSQQPDRKLSVHHVNFKKDSCCNNDIAPLFVPLCTSCHMKTNYNRSYWESHFTEIIEKYYDGKCYFTQDEYLRFKHANN